MVCVLYVSLYVKVAYRHSAARTSVEGSAWQFLTGMDCRVLIHPPSSQTLKNIEENYGVHLDLSAEGRAVIFTHDSEKMEEAVRIVRELVHEISEVPLASPFGDGHPTAVALVVKYIYIYMCV